MKIDSIQNGIVLDHITAGKALQVYHDLELDKLDCSVAILQNVKSSKMGKKDILKIDKEYDVNLDVIGYIDPDITVSIIKDGQISVLGMHISPYEKGNIFNKDPRRPRRLLMHKREILKLFAKIKQDGYALVPLSIYFKGPRVKLEIGLAKGKKLYDKREAAAKRDAKREMDRAIKMRSR